VTIIEPTKKRAVLCLAMCMQYAEVLSTDFLSFLFLMYSFSEVHVRAGRGERRVCGCTVGLTHALFSVSRPSTSS